MVATAGRTFWGCFDLCKHVAEGILFGPNGPRGTYRPELEDSAEFGRAVPRNFYIKPTGWNASDQLVISVSGTTAPTGTELNGNTQCPGDNLLIKQGDDNAILTPGLVNRTSGTFAYQVTVTQAAANNSNGVYVQWTPGRTDKADAYAGWVVHWVHNAIG